MADVEIRATIFDVENSDCIQILRHRRHGSGEEHHRRRPRLHWHWGLVDEIVLAADRPLLAFSYEPLPWEGPHDMSFTLKDNQEVSFAVTASDAAGQQTALTGTPAFSVDDQSVLALTDNGDGSGKVSAQGRSGTATLSVADQETNGRQFIGSVAIDVVAGDVATVGLSLGQPTDIQAAPAPAAPVDQPAAPTDQPAAPPTDTGTTGTPAAPTDQPAAPVDQPAAPVDQPAAPTDQPAAPTGQEPGTPVNPADPGGPATPAA